MDILIIEDDIQLAEHLASELKKYGHNATIANSVKEAISKDLANSHDIVILDLLLKDEHGADFVQYINKENIKIPIIVLSSLANTNNKIELLRAGVDDYMTKPFDINELLARLETVHKRYLEISHNKKVRYDGVTFIWDENKVIREGKEIYLTNKESKLLRYLVLNHGKVVKSEDIIKHVWNVGPGYHSNILQSLIRHIRKRLDEGFDYQLIKNIHGVGYMIEFPK